MPYHILFTKAAQRQFNKLDNQVQAQLKPKIDALADAPRPPGYIKLHGVGDLYRIDSGNYRIVYSIEDKILTVEIVVVAES